MHQLPDEKLTALLDAAPDAEEAIKELFAHACDISRDRVYLAILDIERLEFPGRKPQIAINCARGWGAVQVARFYSQFATVPEGLSDDEEELLRYLQLLCYSQIWECLAIQRLLLSLARTAAGKEYEPNLLLSSDPGTAKVVNRIRQDADISGLSLTALLDALYHGLIRNSFAHSDLWVQHGAISTAPDITSRGPTFYMRFATWDRLFAMVGAMLTALFRERRAVEAELASQSPKTFSLAEFRGPFTVCLDNRNHWTFVH